MFKIDEIIKFVLTNDLKYTGAHQSSHPRTKVTLQILEPEMQLKLIWKALLKLQLQKSKKHAQFLILHSSFLIYLCTFVKCINN